VLDVLLVTFPFFALVLAGYVAARRRMLPFEAIGGLNTFVLFFALPCMLYRFGASTPIAQMLDPSGFTVWLACALLMVAGTVKFSMNSRIRWNDASFGALVAAFPNTGFMGVPLLAALFGAAVVGPMIATILIDMFVTSSLCIALAQAGGPAGNARAAALRSLRGAVSNPLPWSIALGGALGALGGARDRDPGVHRREVTDAATPVALFTIGAVLARPARPGDVAVRRRRIGDVPLIAVIKLVVHPALVLGAGRLLQWAGLRLDDLALTVLVLIAALPSASSIPMLAERFGADNGRIARIILTSTVLSFVTFTSLASWFGSRL